MKMKLRLTLLLVLSLTLFGSFAFADVGDISDGEVADYILAEVIEDVNAANETIEDKIEKAIEKADLLASKNIHDSDKYDDKLDKLIDKLIDQVNEIAQETIADAAEKGVTVTCVLVAVEINERVVWIDPLIVGGF